MNIIEPIWEQVKTAQEEQQVRSEFNYSTNASRISEIKTRLNNLIQFQMGTIEQLDRMIEEELK